ncbi:MAG: hypothetical protein AAF213_10890 [Pseudomonadota bacterium]
MPSLFDQILNRAIPERGLTTPLDNLDMMPPMKEVSDHRTPHHQTRFDIEGEKRLQTDQKSAHLARLGRGL